MNVYAKLFIVAILPAILTYFFTKLENIKFFNELSYVTKQIIFGIGFGLLAIIGTEWGIPYSGAVVNARDAAVLTAGLLFGAPAGIIAGLLGGIERYIAVYWGVGSYTRIACSISTALAGFYSAGLRKHMFDDSKPSWALAFAIGLVMEVFHMTMVFITNISDATHAMEVVKLSSNIMIPVNSIATALSTIVAIAIAEENNKNKNEKLRIDQTIQRWLLLTVALAFFVTSFFTYRLQTSIADETTKQFLNIAIEDVTGTVEDASDKNLLKITKEVKKQLDSIDIKTLAKNKDIAEISLVNKEGIIFESNVDEYIGFDMSVGEQSKEFMCLLLNEEEFVQEYGPISRNQNEYRKYAGIKTDYGFLQVGYNAKQFQDDIKLEIVNSSVNRHIGNSGYVLIADEQYEIVSIPQGHNITAEEIKQLSLNDDNVVIKTIIDGEECFVMCNEVEGYYVTSIYPKEEAYRTRNIVLYVNTFLEILIFAVMFALIYSLIRNIVVKKLQNVNKALIKISDGNLNEVVDVNSNEEFVMLSKHINSTVSTLKQYIAEASKKIDEELENAKNIQISALPHTFPESDRYEIYALMDAAKEVGGDFYDFFRTSKHTVNFLIADVSGKGIPGAMFMMRAKSELHSLTETGIDVNEVFTYGNNSLCEGNDAGMFVTAWEGKLDLETGLVKFANAGHNPPVLMHEDGSCEYIRGKAGFVLAGMEEIQYKQQELQMKPGDVLFLYTDGVTEATNANNELFGEDRLINCLTNMDRSVDMEYLCCEVIGEIGRFVGDNEQFDDITMLAIKYKGNK